MKVIIFLLLFFCATYTDAQVKKVSILASGLTCSMCDKVIYKALMSVDFVNNVDADIKSSTFEITFKPDANIDFDKLKKKVEDAGFFVAGFWATIHFDNLKIKKDVPVETAGKNLIFLNISDQELNGDKRVKFLDRGYVPVREYKKNAAFTTNESYKTGTADAPFTENGIAKGARIYHVTI